MPWQVLVITFGFLYSAGKFVNVELQIYEKPKVALHSSKHVPSSYIAEILPDVYYTGWLQAGTPPQTVSVMFDIRVTDIWLSSISVCFKEQGYCESRQVYDYTESLSYRRHFDRSRNYYEFLSGVDHAETGTENITLGGYQVTNQMIAIATDIKKSSLAYKHGGVVGLSVSKFSNNDGNSLIMNFAEQDIIDEQIFSFKINRSEGRATLILGEPHPQYLGRSFTYASLVSDTRWMIVIDRVLVNDEVVGGPCLASPAPMSSAIVGPPHVIRDINHALTVTLQRYGWSYVDCKNISNLPMITFIISNEPFTLGPKDYIFKSDIVSSADCWSVFRSAVSLDHILLGLPFLQRFYAIYDLDNTRIGFTQA